eukprot:6394335-Heterocapsa_arctica.AAC.1
MKRRTRRPTPGQRATRTQNNHIQTYKHDVQQHTNTHKHTQHTKGHRRGKVPVEDEKKDGKKDEKKEEEKELLFQQK